MTEEGKAPQNARNGSAVAQTCFDSVRACEVCHDTTAIYKCPNCGTKTCSLGCCKRHKTNSGCDGRRDPAKFIALKSFKEHDLRHDYHFLEDVLQTKTSARRTVLGSEVGHALAAPPLKRGRQNKPDTPVILSPDDHEQQERHGAGQVLGRAVPKGIKKFVVEARERGTNVLIMPSGMSRRRLNTSRYDNKKRRCVWRTHLVFILPNQPYEVSALLSPALDPTRQNSCSKNGLAILGNAEHNRALVSTVITDCDESARVDELVKNILETGSHTRDTNTLASSNSAVIRSALSTLRAHLRDVKVLIQKIPSRSEHPTFLPISLDSTLAEALRGKTVIEYPTLFVGLVADMIKMERFIAPVEPVPMEVGGEEAHPLDSPGKKARLETAADGVAQERSGINVKDGEDSVVDEEQEGDEGEADDESAEEFMRVIHEIQDADTEALKNIIANYHDC